MVAEQKRSGADTVPEGPVGTSTAHPGAPNPAGAVIEPTPVAASPSIDNLPVMTWRSDATGRRDHVN